MPRRAAYIFSGVFSIGVILLVTLAIAVHFLVLGVILVVLWVIIVSGAMATYGQLHRG